MALSWSACKRYPQGATFNLHLTSYTGAWRYFSVASAVAGERLGARSTQRGVRPLQLGLATPWGTTTPQRSALTAGPLTCCSCWTPPAITVLGPVASSVAANVGVLHGRLVAMGRTMRLVDLHTFTASTGFSTEAAAYQPEQRSPMTPMMQGAFASLANCCLDCWRCCCRKRPSAEGGGS